MAKAVDDAYFSLVGRLGEATKVPPETDASSEDEDEIAGLAEDEIEDDIAEVSSEEQLSEWSDNEADNEAVSSSDGISSQEEVGRANLESIIRNKRRISRANDQSTINTKAFEELKGENTKDLQ